MRRLLIAAAATGLLAGAASQAGAALRITPQAVSLLAAGRAAAQEPVFAARAGRRYRFEVDYEVSGAARIGTGHLFAFEDAVSGRRLEVASRSFPPEPPGAYTESSTMTIPSSWEPGVYRLRWTVTARNPREESVRASGARVFLVTGTAGG